MVLIEWNHFIWAEVGTRAEEQLNPEALRAVDRYTACINNKMCTCQACQLQMHLLSYGFQD